MWTIEYEETNLVSRHRGTLPVILSCPHDGEDEPSGVPVREGSPPGCPPVKISRDLHTRAIAEGVAQRLLDLFGEAPYVVIAEEVAERPGAATLTAAQGHLRFDDVTFAYEPGKPVLSGITFEARPGELVALVGPSGSGKTTITYLASRLCDPTSGAVRIDGRDVRDLTLESLAGTIGKVTQES